MTINTGKCKNESVEDDDKITSAKRVPPKW